MSYPATLDTAQDLLIAANNFATTCIGTVTSGQDAVAITASAGLPASGVVSIDSEVIAYGYIDVTGLNPVLRDCSRGFDGTSPAQHVSGSKVELRWVATHHNILSIAIRAIQGALGVNPHGTFTDLATRLSLTLPITLARSVNTVWTFTHNRKRVVSVQLWRKVATNQYELFDAAMTQEVNASGDSTVTIELAAAEEGYVIYS